jgi:hypothetical protein
MVELCDSGEDAHLLKSPERYFDEVNGALRIEVFFDALRVKIREEAVVRNKAIYLALGVLPDGTREISGREHRGRQVSG